MNLDALQGQVDALDEAPLHTHPDALESVHRALVDDLDGLAGAGRVAPGSSGPHDRPAR